MTLLNALNPDETTGKAKELFDSIHKKLGMVPNMMRTMGNSPAFLEAYLGLGDSLGKGSLGSKLGELLAITVAQENNCDYCLSAHSYIGEKLLKIDEQSLRNARYAVNSDSKTNAALQFAKLLVEKKGMVSDEDVSKIKNAGFTEGEIGEIVGHVALNVMTNYFNNTANTVIDFPVVSSAQLEQV